MIFFLKMTKETKSFGLILSVPLNFINSTFNTLHNDKNNQLHSYSSKCRQIEMPHTLLFILHPTFIQHFHLRTPFSCKTFSAGTTWRFYPFYLCAKTANSPDSHKLQMKMETSDRRWIIKNLRWMLVRQQINPRIIQFAPHPPLAYCKRISSSSKG